MRDAAAQQRDARGTARGDAQSDPRLGSVRQADGRFSRIGSFHRCARRAFVIDDGHVGNAFVVDRHAQSRRALIVEEAHPRDAEGSEIPGPA